MNLFDLYRGRSASQNRVPAPSGKVVVPHGHQVVTHRPSAVPQFTRSNGGVWVANSGTSSDRAMVEIEQFLYGVKDVLLADRTPGLLVLDALRSSDLFAPNDPKVSPFEGALLWVLDPGAFIGSGPSPLLLQKLFRTLHIIRTRSKPPLPQFFSVLDVSSQSGRFLAELLLQFDFSVRAPDPTTGAVLLEVQRPEGLTLTALTGTPFHGDLPADPILRQINADKDCAEEEGDVSRLRHFEEQELEELTRRLATVQTQEKSVVRAPHLNRLLLQAESSEEAWREFCEELLRRDIPLLVVIDPKTRGASHRIWPGGVTALPVYTDQASVLQYACDVNIPREALVTAEMPPRDLFRWMSQHRSAVAINVYRDPETPLYVMLRVEAVKALAAGGLPAFQ